VVQEAGSLIVRWTVCLLLALVACAKSRNAMEASRVVADTGGYSFKLLIKQPSQQRYEALMVSREGRVGYAGGMAAMEGLKPAYERALTPDEADAFRAAILACPWTEAKPDDRGPYKAEPITEVRIGMPSGIERTFTLRGEQPEVDKWVKLLKPWVKDRHKSELDLLPKATEPPKVEGAEQLKPQPD
jgi:hypothetical protein